MINQLLHQLAARSDDNPRTARRQLTEPAGLFATELNKQLIGAEHRPTRDAEADSIDEALRREVKGTGAATRDREVTLTDLLLEPRGDNMEEEAAAFEEERTAPEVPHLRSSAEQLRTPVRGRDESMFQERLREQALARFTGDASSTSRQAMVWARGGEAERGVPVIGRGAAQSLAAAVDQAAREHHPTKPIRAGLLNPAPPPSTRGERTVTGSENARPVILSGQDAQRWATPQTVSTLDKAWKPAASGEGDASPASPEAPAATAPSEPQPVETLTADAVTEVAEPSTPRAFDETLRHVVEGDRALAAQTGATATTSAMRAVVDQVRSLMEGLGLEGQLRLRTDGAEVEVQSDVLGTLAARIGVTNGVVDLTLSGQAAASLTADLDALKQMLVEAGLSVGDVKTDTQPGGEHHAQRHGGRDQDPPEPRSGSGIATDEGQAREASRARRRSHHGQVNVSA